MVNKKDLRATLETIPASSSLSWEKQKEEFSVKGLYEMLQGRKAEMPENSYTTYLFEKGLDKILKKVGEESTGHLIAGKAEDKAETVYEIADLAYHVMVLMVELGISVDDVLDELASRHIIDTR
ncbi:MAG: phosphoribosyl-ATP diphosphatase [Clostridia bacterium]